LSEAPESAISDSACPGLRVTVAATPHTKCERCWHHRPDVGHHEAHPLLCGRCIENIEGGGEARLFA